MGDKLIVFEESALSKSVSLCLKESLLGKDVTTLLLELFVSISQRYGWIVLHPVGQILLDFLQIKADAIEVEFTTLPIGSCLVVLPYYLLGVRLMLILGKVFALSPLQLESSEGEDFAEEEEEVSCGYRSLFAGVLVDFLYPLAVPLKIVGNGLHQ